MMPLDGSKKDFLTNCYMKEELMPFLMSVWTESKAYKRPFSILLIDVDRFKSFNDKYGHLCGDEVLKYFSSSLRLTLGDSEHYPFRFGGDEFVVAFPGKTSGEVYLQAVKLAKNIKSRHFLLKGRQFKMTFSGGVASYPGDGETVEQILDRADKAMYSSKRSGHGNTTQYSKRWLKGLGRVIKILFLLAICSGVFLFHKYLPNGKFGKFKFKPKPINFKAIKIPISLPQEKGSDTIFLKSGGILKGKIIREGEDEFELQLNLDRGQGSMMIKKSDIKSIEKGKESSLENPPK